MGEGESQIERLRSLIAVSRSLTGELDLNDIIHGILGAVIRVIPGADVGILFLYDHDTRRLVVSHCAGLGPQAYDIKLAPGEGMSGTAFLSGKPAIYTSPDQAATLMTKAREENLRLFEEATGGIRYPQSALSAALISKGQPIGAFVVENLHVPQAFDEFDLDLVDALAQVAASAIVNARLFESEKQSRIKLEALNEEIRSQRDQLQRRIDLQASLLEVVKEGLPLGELAARLARLTRGSAVILDALNRVRATHPDIPAETARELGWAPQGAFLAALDKASTSRTRQRLHNDGTDLLIAPIVGGNEVLGFIALSSSDGGFDTIDEDAADTGALVAATEFLKERAVEETEIHRRADLLEQLLQGRVPQQAAMISALHPPLGIAGGVLRSEKERRSKPDVRIFRTFVALTQEAIEFSGTAALITPWNDHVIVIWSLSTRSCDQMAGDLLTAASKVERVAPGWRASFAIGSRTEGLHEIPATCSEIRLALEVREQLERHEPVFHVDSLGAYRFILRSAADAHVAELCRQTLGEVIRYDTTRGTDLLGTFRTYLNTGSSIKETARALNVHPHTVQYRLERLQQLSGLRLSRPDERLTLEMALRLVDVFRLVDPSKVPTHILGIDT